MDSTASFYSQPSHDFRGGGFPVFAGSRRQRGGGIFGTLKSSFAPVAKTVGKSLLSHGLGLARDVAHDALAGRSIKDSLLDRGKSRAVTFGKSTLSNMIGKGSRRAGRRRRSRKRGLKRKSRSSSRKRTSHSRKAVSRKRKARSVSSHRRKAKRRRRASNF